MMGKKVKSQNDKFSLEKEMKMIAIHLSCRHFIPINNPSTEKERWYERAAVRIFYIDFSSKLNGKTSKGLTRCMYAHAFH